jgi:predicted deacylase
MPPRIRRVLTAAALGVAAVSMTGTAAVAEQAPTPLLPSVSVRPLHVDPAAANHGGWFVFRLSPGQVGSNAALVTNVSSAAEFVTAYARDLSFRSTTGSSTTLARGSPLAAGP